MKVFAFFGSQVDGQRPHFLRNMRANGYSLLALDAPAVGAASLANVPFSLIGDWIDSGRMLAARKLAHLCEREWFESAREEFTSEGICWPDFDRHAMHWFWADVFFANACAEALRMSGVKEFRFYRNQRPRPAIYYSPSDVVNVFWENELFGSVEVSTVDKLPTPSGRVNNASALLHRIAASFRKFSFKREIPNTAENINLSNLASAISGKIVFALNPAEVYRFDPIMQELSEFHPGMLAVVLLSSNPAVANKVRSGTCIPVLPGPSSKDVDPSLQRRFLNGYRETLNSAGGEPFLKPLEYLSFHFNYFCEERWPKLARAFQVWTELWNRSRPQAVIVSSLQDSESQLPAEAAKRIGIPTFSLPHGAGMTRSWDIACSDYILYSLMTQKIVFERSGIQAKRLIGCRGLCVQNEYTTLRRVDGKAQTSWRVLALTDPIGLPGCLAPSITPNAQLEAFKILDNPPIDTAQRMTLKIKTHPNYPDSALFALFSKRQRNSVLPADSELRSVLENTDLVVAVNYSGAALVHSVRAGKPVIFLWTDDLIGKADPHLFANIFLDAGIVVRNYSQFWDSVRKFFRLPEFAQELYVKSSTFKQNCLNDHKYPSINEIFGGTLGGNLQEGASSVARGTPQVVIS